MQINPITAFIMKEFLKNVFLFLICFVIGSQVLNSQVVPKRVIPAAERLILYKPAIKNKTIALVANHTSMVGKTHLVDTLISMGANIKKIFCPEHGFRGTDEAGKTIKNGKDEKTGIPIISLYGKKLKPSAEDLSGIDVVIYDIQDVGVRFYTYISTLTYVMQACAENLKLLMILDRPNPNGFYVDGPVLDMKYKSFVGMLPIPVVYGMTVGELATMINEEKWLPKDLQCSLGIIPCLNYTHKVHYRLEVNPSPNLRSMSAVYLYPSLGLFEGTVMNVGRGTDFPFQVFGHPQFKDTTFSYTPMRIQGSSILPLHFNKVCYGVDLRGMPEAELEQSATLDFSFLRTALENYPVKEKFFNKFFENLSGNGELRKQIIAGMSDTEIRNSWEPALSEFKAKRKKYLIYEDFE
jgi:uncharacterized protein YbbC (DUF1343 family)